MKSLVTMTTLLLAMSAFSQTFYPDLGYKDDVYAWMSIERESGKSLHATCRDLKNEIEDAIDAKFEALNEEYDSLDMRVYPVKSRKIEDRVKCELRLNLIDENYRMSFLSDSVKLKNDNAEEKVREIKNEHSNDLNTAYTRVSQGFKKSFLSPNNSVKKMYIDSILIIKK